jgi:sec-independent protein translocase protein TatB
MIGNLGMGEMLIIAVIALVVMGPEKFPEFAKIALRAFRDVRGYVDDVKREMTNELRPVRRELDQLARHKPEEYIDRLTGAVTDAMEGKDSAKDAPEKPSPYEESDAPRYDETPGAAHTESDASVTSKDADSGQQKDWAGEAPQDGPTDPPRQYED